MRTKSLLGIKFGKLLVLEKSLERDSSGNVKWLCLCSCGKLKLAATSTLKNGKCQSCGCYQKEKASNYSYIELKNKIFGRLVVVDQTDNDKKRQRLWLCKCQCGNLTKVSTYHLKSGLIKSCGCLQKESVSKAMTKHGQSASASYRKFHCAKRRSAKLQRTPPWSDLEKIKQIYESSPKDYEVDHIYPLQGKLVSGLHVPNNLRCIPKEEHWGKNNSFEPEYVKPNISES